jgi:predicted dinucleotide-binding enzyme
VFVEIETGVREGKIIVDKKIAAKYNPTKGMAIYMKTQKSTIEEIRERFDHDVERFSNLDTGQVSTVDAKRTLEIIAVSNKNDTCAKRLIV